MYKHLDGVYETLVSTKMCSVILSTVVDVIIIVLSPLIETLLSQIRTLGLRTHSGNSYRDR